MSLRERFATGFALAMLVVALALACGCGSVDAVDAVDVDAAADVGTDAAADVGTDAAADVATEPPPDAAADVGGPSCSWECRAFCDCGPLPCCRSSAAADCCTR